MLLDAYLYKPNVSEINNNEYVYNFKFDSNQFGVNNDFMCLNGTILEEKTVNYIKHKLQDVMVKSNIKITILEPIEVYNMESNRQMAIYNGSNSLSDYRLVIQYKKKKIIIALDIKW